MKKKLVLLMFVLLISLLTACGGSMPVATSRPATPTSVQFASGPKGLPLYCPQGVALDTQGNIYVSDNDQGKGYSRLVKLSPSGQLLGEWDPFKGVGPFQNLGPYYLAVDPQGTIYVADKTDETVKKLSASGQVLATWGGMGSAPGQFDWPWGVAVDPQGNVYISDFNNSRVQKFSPLGKVLAELGTQELDHPTGIAVDSQGNLYVSDHPDRIVKFSSTGQFLAAWGTTGNAPGQFNHPHGVAVDSQGNIYVADADNTRIVKLSPEGRVLAIWDQSPYGLAELEVDSQGNVYAAEGSTAIAEVKLEKLSPTGKPLATWKASCAPQGE